MRGPAAEFKCPKQRTVVALQRLSQARAKSGGTKSEMPIGRSAVSSDTEARIRELRAAGSGVLKVARMVGCGVSVVQRVDTQAA